MKNFRKMATLVVACLVSVISVAQVKVLNDGAKVNIQSNTYLTVYDAAKGGTLTNQNSGGVSVSGMLTVNGTLTNNATLTVESDGSLIDYGTATGQSSTVKRIMTAGDIHFVSQPVASAQSNVFTGAFVKKYDEPANNWIALSNGQNLTIMNAYSVDYADKVNNSTLTFSGILNTGNKSLSLTNLGGGWNLVGNPYPSAIDWNKAGWTKDNVDNTLYFWDGTNYKYYIGTGGSTPDGAIYTIGGTNIIPAMQGFFVKASGQASLGLTNDVRTHNPQAFYKKSGESETQYLRLIAEGNGHTDEALVYFNTKATNGFDSNFDAYKLISTTNGMPQLFTSTTAGTDLAINSLSEFDKSMTIPMNFTANIAGTYTIKLADYNLANEIYLYDAKNDKITNLATDREQAIVYDEGDNVNRFTILFSLETSSIVRENAQFENIIKVYAHQKDVIVEVDATPTQSYKADIFDVLGRNLLNREITTAGKNTLSINFVSGTYFVKVTNGTRTTTKKVVIAE